MKRNVQTEMTSREAPVEAHGGTAEHLRKVAFLPVGYGNIGAILAVTDTLTVTTLSVISSLIYNLIAFDFRGEITNTYYVGILSSIIFIFACRAQGLYKSDKILQTRTLFYNVIITWTLTAIILIIAAFLMKASVYYSRGASIVFFVAGTIVLPFYRYGAARLFMYVLNHGLFASGKNIVLFGALSELQRWDLGENLKRHGYGVVEQVGIRLEEANSLANARMIASATARLKDVIKRTKVDEIFLALDVGDTRTMDLVIDRLRDFPIPVRLLFDPRLSSLLASDVSDLGAARAVKLQSGPLTSAQQHAKRAFDLFFSILALIGLAPFFIVIAIAIRWDSPGPILFRQRRAGFSGRVFRIYKFRTMTTLDDGDVVRQAQKNDARVTRVGRFLRRTSIDELPQLLNVILGQMSLVGPRPHAISHDDEYGRIIASYALRHHMRPGLTGWAQVNGFRGETNTIELMEARVKFDLWYVANWSLILDLKTIGMTIVQMFTSKEVY